MQNNVLSRSLQWFHFEWLLHIGTKWCVHKKLSDPHLTFLLLMFRTGAIFLLLVSTVAAGDVSAWHRVTRIGPVICDESENYTFKLQNGPRNARYIAISCFFKCVCGDFFFALTHQALKLYSLGTLDAVHSPHLSTCIADSLLCSLALSVF